MGRNSERKITFNSRSMTNDNRVSYSKDVTKEEYNMLLKEALDSSLLKVPSELDNDHLYTMKGDYNLGDGIVITFNKFINKEEYTEMINAINESLYPDDINKGLGGNTNGKK